MMPEKKRLLLFMEDLDVRCKLVCLSILSLSLLCSGPLSAASALVLLTLFHQGVFGRIPFKEALYLMPMLLLVLVARALTTPGDTWISVMEIPITSQGMEEGLVIGLRLLTVVVSGLLFSGTTRASQIKAGAQWLLKPIPLIPEKRAAVMIALFFRFMPLLAHQAREISQARQARCGNLKKNPVKQLVQLAVPLLQKTFRSADLLSMAMEARCYSEERTDQNQTPSGHEARALGAVITLSLFLIFL